NASLANIWMPSGGDLWLFSPELALVATLAAMLIVPIITGRSNQIAAATALLGSLAALILASALLYGPVRTSSLGGFSPAGATPILVIDKFAVFFKILLMIFLVSVTWLWMMGQERGSRLVAGVSEPGYTALPASQEGNGAEFFVLLIT